MYCSKCGSQMADTAVFCPNCGARVASLAVNKPEREDETVRTAKPKGASAQHDAVQQRQAQPPVQQRQAQPPVQQKQAPAYKPKKERTPMKKGTKALIILITAVVLLGALAIGGYSLIKNSAAYEAIQLIDDGKYELATKAYNRDVADDKVQSVIFNTLLKSKYNKALSDYADGKTSYSEALDYLAAIMDMDVIDNAGDKFKEILTKRADDIVTGCGDGSIDVKDGLDELVSLIGYEADYTDGDYVKGKLEELIKNRADALLAGFSEGSMEYDACSEELNSLVGIENANLTSRYAGDIKAQIDELNRSASAFSRAEQYYADGNLVRALEEYAQITEDSPYYADAQEKMAAAMDDYRSEMLASAESKKSSGDYTGAIALLESALTVLKDDEQLTACLDSYTGEYHAKVKSDALSEATQLRSQKKYIEAIGVIKNALGIIGSDSELSSLENSCVSAYVDDVTKQVQDVIDSDWATAKQIVDKAKTDLPGNADIEALYNSVVDAKPVNLEEVYAIVNNNFEFNQQFEDTYQNWYTRSISNNSYYWDANIVFNLDRQYKSLSFTLAPQKDISQYSTVTVRIYSDDSLIYSAEVTRFDHAVPVTINVTGTGLLKIEASAARNKGIVLFADPILKK